MYNPSLGAFIQRLVFSLLFVVTGLMHLLGWSGTIQATSSVFGQILAVPFAIGATLALVGGGFLLLLNILPRVGGFMITVFLVLASYVHFRWSGMAMDEMLRQAQMAHMIKNFALIGVSMRYTLGG